MLPVFVYIVLRANVPRLMSNIAYIERFRNPSALSSRAGYSFVNLRSAVFYLQAVDAASVSMEPATWDRCVCVCGVVRCVCVKPLCALLLTLVTKMSRAPVRLCVSLSLAPPPGWHGNAWLSKPPPPLPAFRQAQSFAYLVRVPRTWDCEAMAMSGAYHTV